MVLPFKVCCIQSVEEAEMAIAAGARAVGLVAEMPSGPGHIPDKDIRDIAAHFHASEGDKVWTVLLTSRIDGEAIADHAAETGVNTVQIVDAPTVGAYERLRKAHPPLRIIQVIHVEDDSAVDAARRAAEHVDVILLDSGKPNAAVKTLGGTGDVHDWSISKQIVEAIDKPVFLAGGLNPENVREAVAFVNPYGVDICSGLRDKVRNYALQADKLRAFAAQLVNS